MNQIIFLKPIVTEKAISAQQSQDKYAFWVNPKATKDQIESSFKTVFGIKPLLINTNIIKGKTKINWKTRQLTKKNDRKKVIITVSKGTKIELLKLNTK